jgi:hypothetical protein
MMKGVFDASMVVLIFTEKALIGYNYNVVFRFFPNYLKHSILALYASELSEAYVRYICLNQPSQENSVCSEMDL